MAASQNLIVALGNPLLDITAAVDETWLEKYGLKANDAILAEEKHLPLYEELAAEEGVTYTAGGATQNSIRVAQYKLKTPQATTFIGCVGNDEFGSKLKTAAEADGVCVEYLVDETTPTGTCGCVITGTHRSLVANLAAANNYKPEHLRSEDVWAKVTGGHIYYSAGFHLTVSPEAMLDIARHAAENNKIFAFNLSAPFLCQFFKEPMLKVLPFADLVFGNEDESATFAKQNDMEETEDLEKIALAIASHEKVNQQRQRIVVITCGAESTIVATDGKVETFPVEKLDKSLIVDTNGAGDAFVGGFLAALALDKPIAECVEAGHETAKMIIQVSGIVLPKDE